MILVQDRTAMVGCDYRIKEGHMYADTKEGNLPEKGVEEVTLRDIRDEIRKQGQKSREHQTGTHWLTTGLLLGMAVLAAGIGVLTTTTTYHGLGIIMVAVGAVYIVFVIGLTQFYSKRTN
jgi:hypothetical protein